MPNKKYDFTSCVLDGCIYTISGRDSFSEIIEKCEKYNYLTDEWTTIAPVHKKRYAASCASVQGQGKVFLFGGRSETNNHMIEEIEEYDTALDEWKIVRLKELSTWIPVEVAAMVQVEEDTLLIFGGSDANVRDTQNSYMFHVSDYSLEKTDNLQRPQVFVASPVCYGKHVYAIGNEYYVRNRSLNRFNVDKRDWNIIF